jgi:hypothetical protein
LNEFKLSHKVKSLSSSSPSMPMHFFVTVSANG